MSQDEGKIVLIDDEYADEMLQDWGTINQDSKSSFNWSTRKINDETLPKRSEKFFDQDGTDTQKLKLEDARNQMYLALLHLRGHHVKQLLIGVWVQSQNRAFIPHARGGFFKDMGTSHAYKAKRKHQGLWLSGIEAIYLTERGSLVMYAANDEFLNFIEDDRVLFDYETLQHLSISHLYTLVLGMDTSLIDKYKVFALLKRLGYSVMEHRDIHMMFDEMSLPSRVESVKYKSFASLFKAYVTSFGSTMRRLLESTLQERGHFFTFTQVFSSLALDQRTQHPDFNSPYAVNPIYRTVFDVWKPSPHFSKKNPPIPDFRIGIINTSTVSFPDLYSLRTLWAQASVRSCSNPKNLNPKNTTSAKKELKAKTKAERESKLNPKLRDRNNYLRTRDKLLKEGSTGKSVTFAVVDNGIVNFTTFNETDFRLQSCTKGLNELEKREEHGIVWNERLEI